MRCVSVLLVVLLLAGQGCQRSSGPDVGVVSGTITFDGELLEAGEIVFRDPAGQIPSAGCQIVNGQYSTRSIPAVMRVEVTDTREVPGQFNEVSPGLRVPKKVQYIPARYNDQSDLTANIQKGANQFNFDLTAQ